MRKKKCGKIEVGVEVKRGVKLKRCDECEYRQELRPCEVDGKICTFHRFAESDHAIIKLNAMVNPSEHKELIHQFEQKSIVPAYCNIEVIRVTFALVEYPDGSVGKVDPDKVHFLDRKED